MLSMNIIKIKSGNIKINKNEFTIILCAAANKVNNILMSSNGLHNFHLS